MGQRKMTQEAASIMTTNSQVHQAAQLEDSGVRIVTQRCCISRSMRFQDGPKDKSGQLPSLRTSFMYGRGVKG